jgi:hypothetical protein
MGMSQSAIQCVSALFLFVNPDERPSNGLSEAMMKIKRTQGFHPRRVKFDFHTNLHADEARHKKRMEKLKFGPTIP